MGGMQMLGLAMQPIMQPMEFAMRPLEAVGETTTSLMRSGATRISDTVIEPIRRQSGALRDTLEESFPVTAQVANDILDVGEYLVKRTANETSQTLSEPFGVLKIMYRPPLLADLASSVQTLVTATSPMLPVEPPPSPNRATVAHMRNADPVKLPEGMVIFTGDFHALREAVRDAGKMTATPANTAAKPLNKAPAKEH